MSGREEQAEAVYARLFGPRDSSAADADPEFGRILRTLIFGDVFALGDLDDRTRELITVTALSALQTLPQLRAHSHAALNVGVSALELREAIYQLAPFLGFPRTLNALSVLNEVLRERDIALPLPDASTTTDTDRYERGRERQTAIYGTRIRDEFAGLPAPFREEVPRLLTEFMFGDFSTRDGLEPRVRELLGLIALAALGLGPQLESHARGALAAGNEPATLIAALMQAMPYIGFPSALNAVRAVAAAGAEFC